ncbi:MAG: glycosyltransferase [Clostridium sp.]|nr:glycosyltransferase [Clostridium sp.]
MRVSVITVNLNDLEGLKSTVESVVCQTYTDFEYIVVDGGSTDGSQLYISGVDRIDQWVSEPDRGIYNAMNKAIAMAHGDYCIFMNAGDVFYNNQVLEEVVPQLEDADFYVGATILVKEGKRLFWEAPKLPLDMRFMIISAPSHQSTFTRTSLLKSSPYREDFKIVSDWEKFFHWWYFKNCTFVPMKTIVSIFYANGFSWIHKDLICKEKEIVLREVIPNRILSYCTGKQGLEKKIEYAMTKSPLKRDWKLIRNAFKYLIKDAIASLKR